MKLNQLQSNGRFAAAAILNSKIANAIYEFNPLSATNFWSFQRKKYKFLSW